MTIPMTSSSPHDTDGPQPAGSPPPGYPQPGPSSAVPGGPYIAGPGGPYNAASAPYPYPRQEKSRTTAGLLGLLLGWTGAHSFYLGHSSKAWTQLGLTIIGAVLDVAGFFLAFALLHRPDLFLIAPSLVFAGGALITGAGVWGVIEGVLVLIAVPGVPPWGVSADGTPLR